MKKTLLMSLLAMLSVSGTALAADVAAGKVAYAAKGCIGCHGPTGTPMVPTYPVLKGRDAAYIKENLTAFKNGSRKDPTMNAMVAPLSAVDIDNLATYISTL